MKFLLSSFSIFQLIVYISLYACQAPPNSLASIDLKDFLPNTYIERLPKELRCKLLKLCTTDDFKYAKMLACTALNLLMVRASGDPKKMNRYAHCSAMNLGSFDRESKHILWDIEGTNEKTLQLECTKNCDHDNDLNMHYLDQTLLNDTRGRFQFDSIGKRLLCAYVDDSALKSNLYAQTKYGIRIIDLQSNSKKDFETGEYIYNPLFDATGTLAVAHTRYTCNSSESTVKVWDIIRGALLSTFEHCQSIELHPTLPHILIYKGNGIYYIYNLRSGAKLFDTDYRTYCTSQTFDHTGDSIAVAANTKDHKLIYLTDIKSDTSKCIFNNKQKKAITNLRFTPDNSLLISIAGKFKIYVHDIRAHTLLHTIIIPYGWMPLKLSFDGTHFTGIHKYSSVAQYVGCLFDYKTISRFYNRQMTVDQLLLIYKIYLSYQSKKKILQENLEELESFCTLPTNLQDILKGMRPSILSRSSTTIKNLIKKTIQQ